MKKKLLYSLITFGLTALIGVGAFVGLNHKPIKETMAIEAPKKYAKITPTSDNPLDSSKTYYLVAKDYSRNGLGTFYYQTPINIDNSAYAGHNPGNNFLYIASFDVIDNSTLTRLLLVYRFELSAGTYRIKEVSLENTTSGQDRIDIYNASAGVFNRQNCAFTCTNFVRAFDQGDNNYDVYPSLNQFFDIYDLSTYAESYDFNKAFNFNNFYQVTNTFFAQPYNPVVGATTTTTGWEKTYQLGLFYSGGLVFDSIKVSFGRNNGYYFETAPNSKEYKTYNVNAVNASNYYFLSMEYVNSATNFTITACNRTSFTQGDNNYIDFLPAWSNQGFKELQFQNQIDSLFNRSVFNSLSDTEQLNTPTAHTDIGMGNAFSLIGQAFTAWLPILSVSVIPGITLGTLIFLPLIAGIIILIIWIVKR